MNLPCVLCGLPSGSSLVCRPCRKTMTDAQARTVTRLWHERIVAKSFDASKGRGQCHHCREWFPRLKLCGDHFPHTKGSRPDLRYDVQNGVPCCMLCNVSNAPTRKSEPKKVKKPPLCKKCRIRLATKNDLCPFCR